MMRMAVKNLAVFVLLSAFLAQTGAAQKKQLIAAIDPKPEFRWQIVLWLSQNDEAMTEKLRTAAAQTAGHTFVWHHALMERKVSRGGDLAGGKKEIYQATVPYVEPDSLWEARDGRLVVGYKRRQRVVVPGREPQTVGVNTPRLKGDKPIYAPTLELFIDKDGNIYY